MAAVISVAEIGRLASWLNEAHPDVVLFVDNCYGEFVEELEPCHVGAHLVAGSLIKNPGGTLAPSGGYIAGRADLVAAAGRRLSAPGVEGGATLGMNRLLFQGLFNSPQVVGEALKGAELVAECLSQLGYATNPLPGSARTDIIQAVTLGSRERVVAFCEAVQRNSPVGAHIQPVPGTTPGYGDEVIFADGTFIDGSTLELSADGRCGSRSPSTFKAAPIGRTGRSCCATRCAPWRADEAEGAAEATEATGARRPHREALRRPPLARTA